MKRIALTFVSLLCGCATLPTSNTPALIELAAQTATSVTLEALGPAKAKTLAPQVYTVGAAIRSLEGGGPVTASQLQAVISQFTSNTQASFIALEIGTALASVWQMYYPNGTTNNASIEALAAGIEAGAGIFITPARHR